MLDESLKIDCSPKANLIKSLITNMVQREAVVKGNPKKVYDKLRDLIYSKFPKAKDVMEWDDKNMTGSASVLGAEGTVVVESLGDSSLVLVTASIKDVVELVYSEDRAAMEIDKILNQLRSSFM